jgi:creatinine amidohydrolase
MEVLMRFSDLNWFDVQAYLEKDDRVILVIGSCEQHAYLSLLTDVQIPLALADAASQKSGVLVAPPLNFGASAYFAAYPGTISLRIATLLDVVEDMIRSLSSQGFRRFLVMNGHGGNDPVRGRLYEIASQLQKIQINWYAWWQSHHVEAIFEKYQLKPGHANWLEAFQFTKIVDLPSKPKLPPHIPGMLGAQEARKILGDGSFGGPYEIDETIMDEIFSACTSDILTILEQQI